MELWLVFVFDLTTQGYIDMFPIPASGSATAADVRDTFIATYLPDIQESYPGRVQADFRFYIKKLTPDLIV
jgi:hypothetical protein